MNTNPLFPALLVSLALVVGCNRESERSAPATEKRSVSTYTKAELDKLIVLGMSAAEVTNTFGPPGSVTEINENVVLFMYSFPIEEGEKAVHLAGFDIYIKDGKVAKWSPIMGESKKSILPGSAQGSFGEQLFQLFVAVSNLTNVASAFDVEGSADTSGLKASPDMVLKAKVFTGTTGNERPGEQTVILVVSDQDASKLKDISENNFGKRLLIVCRNKVVAAPAISAPLASRQLLFTVTSSNIRHISEGK